MDWSAGKEMILSDYFKEYIKQLEDISQFYANIDWDQVMSKVEVQDLEFLKLKADAIFDTHLLINNGNANIGTLLEPWKNKTRHIDMEVSSLINEIGLEAFTKQQQQQQEEEESKGVSVGAIETQPVRQHYDMPKLTKRQKRLSLELIQPKVLGGSLGTNDSQLTTAVAATSTTTVHVTANSKISFSNRKQKNPRPSINPGRPVGKQRRTSIVGEKLPPYIKNQLLGSQQPQKEVASKPTIHKIFKNLSPSQSSLVDSTRKSSSRIQTLRATKSPSLHAHSHDEESINVSDIDQRLLRYDANDDDKEYISPESLAKLYGLMFEEGEDEQIDDDNNDYVNLKDSAASEQNEEEEEEDYLFQI
ncbi:hypothetical protein KGF56_000746 [Candida oxycetoniae]|uniref:Uncharacterized protein n=1 Tax=Candida oxycetoniae TaxID=497107 RepID=A0AAI9WZC4_9ASCO|nr:uncharacterized protein KGF56_000746 [Candida oxycetoniae]KAI3406266.2 hypothetical protein KGF56_000746 [Candida oxycetoniae]